MTSLGGLKLAEGVVVGCVWIGLLGGEAGRGVEEAVWELMIWMGMFERCGEW